MRAPPTAAGGAHGHLTPRPEQRGLATPGGAALGGALLRRITRWARVYSMGPDRGPRDCEGRAGAGVFGFPEKEEKSSSSTLFT